MRFTTKDPKGTEKDKTQLFVRLFFEHFFVYFASFVVKPGLCKKTRDTSVTS